MKETTRQLNGLTAEQVVQNRKDFGPNILTPPKRDSLLKRFFGKLTGPFGHFLPGWEDGDPLVFILEMAAVLSTLISCAEYNGWFGLSSADGTAVFFEPVGILMAIVLATGIAFIFELKADREFSLLNQVDDEQQVKVMRDGHPTTVPRRDVVVGDVVFIETGEEVPADIRLMEAVSLCMDESSLTGEPVCRKSVNTDDFDKEATFPTDCVMRGSKVMEGHGVGKVFAVGDNTENGRVFRAVQIDDSVKTPLNEQLERLGAMVAKISYVLALLVVAGRTATFLHASGCDMGALYSADFLAYSLQSLMLAVTLVVVAVPEGLPMAVTLSLAYSMRRMLQTNNLVRRMHACETMGAATVICTDKTGTLTQNRMQVSVAKIYGTPGDSPRRAEEGMAENMAGNATAELDCSGGSPKVLGNPTEGALLLWLHRNGRDYAKIRAGMKKTGEIPFSTDRKYMATIAEGRSKDSSTVYVKGAPEIVLAMCSHLPGGQSREDIANELASFQDKGMRTLGFACGNFPNNKVPVRDGRLETHDLTYQGFVAISDPVREDVPEAVRECTEAGIHVKVVTGDTTATAREIARQVGLWDEEKDRMGVNIKTGPEIAAMTDGELRACARQVKVVARARPMDKKRLVEALQAGGEVVAVTGDGTNDAPALKAAHVGLSMGDGTAVAKEASDITIVDNSFSSIGRAVMWGRSLYRNIQRFILFQMTVNVAACLVVLAGAFMGTEPPLTVTQMLWVNLIMDTFAAMALASLPPTRKVMGQKPRNRESFIINGPMWWDILGTGLLFFGILLSLLLAFRHADIRCLTDLMHLSEGGGGSLTNYELSLFFTIFVMLQFWNLFNAKGFDSGKSSFNLTGCKGFVTIASAILAGQVLIVNVGQEFFNVVPISLADWAAIIGSTSLVAIVDEVIRFMGTKAS